ncbi:MAG: glycosyltransferase family 39 protein [Elusimicrobia bacterium]|nr:glycosyltransferase family 39 protein [Candidatus Liberimonas magnetica]
MKKYIDEYIGIFLVLGIGLALRLWGLSWGLPLKKAHIDESVVIFYTMKFFSGDLNPHVFFDYPTLFLYLLGFLYFIYFLIGMAAGVFASLDSFVGMFLNGDASALYLIARSLTVFFALAGIYLVYRIGRENLSSGVIPALIMAVIPVNILHSHYGTVDTACVFFILFSVLHLLRYYSSGKKKDLYLGSLIMGLAAAVKYYPFIFVLPVLYLAFEKEKISFLRTSLYSIFFMASGFVLACPFSVLDFPAFISRFIDRFNLIVWSPESSFSFGFFGLFSALVNASTIMIFLLLSFGIILCVKYSDKESLKKILYLLSFPAVYMLFLSTWKIRSPHYLLPVLPFLVLAGSYGLSFIPLLKSRMILIYVVVTLSCLPAVVSAVKLDVSLSKRDTRLLAYDWIKQNLPAGSRILRLPYTPEFMNKDPYQVRVDWEGKIADQPADELSLKYDYIITSHFDNSTVSKQETGILNKYDVINSWANIPLATFHQPRITIYGKKT